MCIASLFKDSMPMAGLWRTLSRPPVEEKAYTEENAGNGARAPPLGTRITPV